MRESLTERVFTEMCIRDRWSVLFTTGYLTKIGEVKVPDSESYAYKLVIPNKEVREVACSKEHTPRCV